MQYLYRLNGGRVEGATVDTYQGIDTRFWGVATNPTVINGTDIGIPKIHDNGTIRDATQAERDNFAIAEAHDDLLLARLNASAYMDTNPVLRKVMRGLVQVMVNEINTLRLVVRTIHPGVAGQLPDRTLAQAKQAIIDIINSGDVD